MTKILTLGGKRCVDPKPVIDAALAQGTPLDFGNRANSYRCPLGPEPGVAWVLIRAADLKALEEDGRDQFFELKWVERGLANPNVGGLAAFGRSVRRTLTAQLCITRNLSMSRTLPADLSNVVPEEFAAGSVRLVELRDRRHIFRMSSVNRSYNVRIPAPSTTSGTGLYYSESLYSDMLSEELWTWQTLCDDLWERLPGEAGQTPAAGTAPTLPYTPEGDPEGFRFIGVNAWDALHEVLDAIGCTTAYNPITDTFSYVRLGTTQSGLSTALEDLSGRLMYDYDPGQDYHLSSMPEVVRVFFHRREQYHGIEKDTHELDTAGNWEMEPAFTKDYYTGVSGTRPASVLVVWDSLPALVDENGDLTNDTALQDRADEVGANLVNRLTISSERFRRMYSGIVTTVFPGSEVSEVIWRDFGEVSEFGEATLGGLVTEIIRRPSDPIEECRKLSERLRPPDLQRASHPLYPRVSQFVRVDDGASNTGTELTANSSGLFPGVVRRWAAGAWSNLNMCWIRPVDLELGGSPDPTAVVKLRQLDTLIGRLAGVETHLGVTRPVYLCRKGEAESAAGDPNPSTKIAVTDEEIDAHDSGTDTPGSGTVSVWEFDNGTISDTTVNLTAYNTAPYPIPQDTLVRLHQEVASDRWLIDTDTEHTIEGFSAGADGSETLYPFETLQIIGDRDQTVAVGNIIDVNITKVGGDTVKVTIDATGTLVTITDVQSPTPGTADIDLGDEWVFQTDIDETMTTQFAEYRITDPASVPTTTLTFGKVFDVTGDTGSVDAFPLEELEFVGAAGAVVAVTKSVNTITVEISAGSGGSGWILRDNQPSPGPNDVTISDGETLQFLSSIDETQDDDWLLWEAQEADPDTMTAIFGRMLIAEDGDGDQESMYPREVLLLKGDRDVSAVVGNIIETEVTKAGDDVTFTINATGGLVTISDDQSPTPGTATLDLGDTLQFKTANPSMNVTVSKLATTITVLIDLASAGGGFHFIQDGDLDTVTLNDSETLRIIGDRDVLNIVGNIIETEVVDLGTTIQLTINAVGDLFTLEAGSDTFDVTLGATYQLVVQIDEAGLPNTFAEFRLSDPDIILAFGKMFDVKDDQASPNTVTVFPTETVHFQTTNPPRQFSVNKVGNEIDLTLALNIPSVTAIIMGTSAILSGGKYYLNDGAGGANTAWARMDGFSNVGPGSGIDMREYFPRGRDATTTAVNTAFGRSGTALTDSDLVTISINDHVDHYHEHQPDSCHCDVPGPSSHYDFAAQTGKLTSGARNILNNPLTLTHTVSITNGQGGSAQVEMLPAHKKLHFFERVA